MRKPLPMNPHEQLIEEFYAGFAAGDADTMNSCYHPDIVFHDPAFGTLEGADVADMWRMLITRGGDRLSVEFSDIKADGKTGSAKWVADYFYAQRPVQNFIKSEFKFENGLIIEQTDSYDLWKWSQQALGFSGLLFGWSSLMKTKIQKQAVSSLRKFQQRNK